MEETIDNSWEHEMHDKKDPHCSSCWTENLVLEKYDPEIERSPYYDNYPEGYSTL